jgi:DNA-binding winged helix-turn-helix (wHTH) protein/LysM repeat protein
VHARQPTRRTRGDILRAFGNLTWTTAVVVGGPLLLARFFGYPLPRQMPDWGDVVSTPMQLVEPAVFINALACIGWITWAVVMIYVVIDLSDLVRGVGQRARRLGPASIVAGKLVASIALLISLLRPQPASTTISRPVAVAQIAEPPAPTAINALLVRADTPIPAPTPTAEAPRPATPVVTTYIVQRGDSLWRIAEQQLGNGFRWKEIHELNKSYIANPDLICAGWTLALPVDAATPDHAPPAAVPAPQAPVPPAATESTPTPAPATTQGPSSAEAPSTPEAPTSVPTTIDHTSIEHETVPSTTPPPSVAHQPEPPASADAPVELPPVSTSPSSTGSTLPLSLRSQRFETQQQYDDWLAQQSTPVGTDNELSVAARAGIVAGALAVPGLLAAGVIGAVDRRRRRVLQRRPVHAALPQRDPNLRPIEAQLRAEALSDPTEQIAWIDTTLRLLTRAVDLDPIDCHLILVQAGTHGIELLWDHPPKVPPPGGFRTVDHTQSWEYPYSDPATLIDLKEDLVGVAPYVRALVSLGDTPDGPILVNLQAVDQIDIDGDTDAVRQWLAAVTVELDAHRWAEPVDVAISAPTAVPTRLTTSIHIDDDGHARPLVWRSDRTQPPAPWQLAITATEAHLRHDEIGIALDVTPVGVDDETFTAVSALLDQAADNPYDNPPDGGHDAPDPSPEPEPAVSDPESADTSDGEPATRLRFSADFTHANGNAIGDGNGNEHEPVLTGTLLLEPTEDEPVEDFTAGALLVVRVLGSVRTEGWHKNPKSPRTEDIVIYLAMTRPDHVTRDRLIDALWNGKDVSTKLLYNYIGTLRKELGEASAVTARDGGYVLDDAIRTDWDHFRHLTRAAVGKPWLERRAALSAALTLIHGRPFGDTDRFGWAATDGTISRIEVALTDTAADLATEALANDDHAMAIWAARRGLMACPWHVRLYGYILEGHAAAGDNIAVQHTWRELQRAAGDDGVPAEMTELYARHAPAAR